MRLLFLFVLLLAPNSAFGWQDINGSGSILPALKKAQLETDLQANVLVEEHNCVACHQSNSHTLQKGSKKSPRLVDIGKRANPYFLEKLIANPHKTKPGTTMPDVLSNQTEEQRENTARAITHFLLSLSNSSFDLNVPDSVAAEKGEALFHSVGCAACHSPRDESGKELLAASSTPLGNLVEKYNVPSLTRFLSDPHRVRPSGRMPNLRLSGRDFERIAHYLLRDTKVPGHLHYTLLQGRVAEGLDVNVEKVRAGYVADFDLKKINNIPHNSAVIYEGLVNSDVNGQAIFYAEMNGGELWINDKKVIDLPPSSRRGVKKVDGEASLVAGWNKIKLIYIHAGREPKFNFEMKSPVGKRAPIDAADLSISTEPIPPYLPYEVDDALAIQGAKAFVQNGCVKCHDDVRPKLSRELLNEEVELGAFAKLDPTKGCLSSESGKWPKLNLSDAEKKIIGSVYAKLETQKLDTRENVHKSLVTFNCIACHDRKGLGGVAPDRNSLFVSDKNELGNEGRIPPPLTLVGAKLRKEWIAEVLLRGGKQRDYMATVMPQFGESNVGHLVDAFEKLDSVDAVKFEKIEDINKVKQAGHQLVGTTGFSCIACHDFNGQKAAGPGALDIIHASSRLKKDWFYHFMLKPGRFRKGTIMPESWPGGHVFMEDILDGDLKKQIESIWVYLEDGTRAKNPIGLSRKSPELRVTDEAVICRGRGVAGYRGMAVGYPERISFAFDTQEMNLRMLWKGEFVSVNPGRFNPRGSDRISFPQGIPFHRLNSLEDNWPYKRKTDYEFPQDHGYRFKGYYLDDRKRPIFTYEYGDIEVEDFFLDRLDDEDKAYFTRTFTFESPTAQASFYFRAASGSKIDKLSDSTYQIDGLQIKFSGSDKAVIREGEPQELLIPIKLPQGKTVLTVEYKW